MADDTQNNTNQGAGAQADSAQGAGSEASPRHTPTPWRLWPYRGTVGYPIAASVQTKFGPTDAILAYANPKQEWIGTEEAKANAAFIVRAVNSYLPMVRALNLVVTSGPLNAGLTDENTMAIAREALALASIQEGK